MQEMQGFIKAEKAQTAQSSQRWEEAQQQQATEAPAGQLKQHSEVSVVLRLCVPRAFEA